MKPLGLRFRRNFCFAAAVALVVVGVLRIVSTYHVFNQTTDEPCHLACGMQWLDQAKYDYDYEDPPLARIAIALGPYLAGLRSTGQPGRVPEGNAILSTGGHYFHNLALARMGILPFFVLTCALVWHWSKRLFGSGAALASVLLFTNLPPVLAHAALATTDMAGCACMFGSIFCFTLWLERPHTKESLWLGFSLGMAMLAKFSSLLFLPLCMLMICLLYWIAVRPRTAELVQRLPLALLSAGAALLLIWTGYRFSYGSMLDDASYSPIHSFTLDQAIGNFSLPAPELFNGLATVQRHNLVGHPCWLLGQCSLHGWWYYFPIVLGVKTPIAFLVLCIAGYVFYFRKITRANFAWQVWVPAACAILILAAVMPAHINIGVRHILLIYPLLSIVAGYAVVNLLRQPNKLAVALCVALIGWQCFVSIRIHPDYLAYFNEFVVGDPSHVLSDSDLDWGQDLQRLSNKLKQLGVRKVTLLYFGSADISSFGLPPLECAAPNQHATGWVAVSDIVLTVDPGRMQREFAWLASERPVAIVGKSIKLYYIPPR